MPVVIVRLNIDDRDGEITVAASLRTWEDIPSNLYPLLDHKPCSSFKTSFSEISLKRGKPFFK